MKHNIFNDFDVEFVKIINKEIQNELDFYIFSEKMLSLKSFNEIKNALIKLFPEQKINLFMDYNDINENEIINFFKENLNKYNEDILQDCKISLFDFNIKITFKNKFLLNQFLYIKEQIKNDLKMQNINIEIIEEFDQEIIKQIEKSQKEIEKIEQKPLKSMNNSLNFGEVFNEIDEIIDIFDPYNIKNIYTIQGKIFFSELRILKKTSLLTIMVHDDTGNVTCKKFPGFNGQIPTMEQLNQIKSGMEVVVTGTKELDRYSNEEVLMITGLKVIHEKSKISKRVDENQDKRIELHLHTKMSKNNGINSLEEYAKLANHFGHKALAITDHDVVQAFVDGDKISKKYDLKIIYGVEANVVKEPIIVYNPQDEIIDDALYVIFDVETTGLSANFNELIEIGAVKYQNGRIIDNYQSFINIGHDLSDFTTQLTGITNDDIKNGKSLENVLQEFKKWCGEKAILVAHNANFDRQFLARNYEKVLNEELNNQVLDTLELSRFLNPENTYHSLKILAKKYDVELDANAHHRADYDAQKLSEIFIKMLEQIKEKGIKTFVELNDKNNVNKTHGYHNLIYVKNQKGLSELYKLVSDANTINLQMSPRMLEKEILKYKENLIYVGSGCSKSEIIYGYLNYNKKEFLNLIKKYQYIEILPPEQYQELLETDIFTNIEEIQQMIINITLAAKKVGIKVLANGNVHFTEPELYICKEMLYAKDYKKDKLKKDKDGNEIEIDVLNFNKWQKSNLNKNQNQYYKTTNELLNEFSFLSNAQEFVIENTNYFSTQVENINIIPKDLYTPEIEGVDEKLINMVYENAKNIYGEKLPEIIIERIEKEIKSITTYGFSVIYYIAHKLVKYSLDNGYLVGSRGSVGSSLVASFMNITEINPLPPHYVCPTCKNSEFILDGSYGSGYDLPIKKCDKCNEELKRDGQDIPFETFLGFKGDKVPDIDLNFSGEFQQQAHEFIRSKNKLNDDELFDEAHSFRAGTIGTLAAKTAYAYIKNYFELISKEYTNTDINYYISFLEGIKRTTGQHPGGIIVVPQKYNIYDFTPIQYPADDKKSNWQTTHFDFHSIHDNLLKLDILGHDDPTMLKKLYDLTKINPQTINITDEKVMQLFSSNKSLKIEEAYDEYFELGTLGVPEFGTDFVMGMLKDTKPKTFSELVIVSGLSHGTDVWLGNAKELIDNNICEFKDVIGCRDDIMVYLMYQGIDALQAFNIMENVRKGKGLTEEEINLLKEKNIPEWYISSCQKIKYMFPKAHACAYVLMALRIAWYKVYYPLEYYCAYFSSRVDDFDAFSMVEGKENILRKIEILNDNSEFSDVKRKNLISSLKMCLEMVTRGYKFLKIDIEKSQSFEFVIDKEENGLIIPFIALEGLGETEAINIVEQRNIKDFKTKEDFKKRTKIKTKTYEQLERFGAFDHLAASDQISLFD